MFDFQFLSFLSISLALSGGVKCQNLHRKIISEIDDDLPEKRSWSRKRNIDIFHLHYNI